MIEIQELQKSFGDFRAVDGVSFSVQPGEVLGFLGPNGAGKSTTMRMITGFLTPSGGAVKVAGADVGADPIAAKRRIGYLPEGAPLYPDMTPRTLLEFIAEVRGVPASERKARIEKVVAQVHIAGVLDQRIDTLSKGFKRRVGLAQALVHEHIVHARAVRGGHVYAKGLDAPIKILFPKELGVSPVPVSMLGLGDIVIPGIFVALMLRFDHKQGFAGTPYFKANFVAYVLGLVATVSVMHFFDAAQPALLYLVPACIGAALLTAAARGELSLLLTYSEEKKEEMADEKKSD